MCNYLDQFFSGSPNWKTFRNFYFSKTFFLKVFPLREPGKKLIRIIIL